MLSPSGESEIMAQTSIKSFMKSAKRPWFSLGSTLGVLTLVLAGACGGSNEGNSGGLGTSGACSTGSGPCPAGCLSGIGCAQCGTNADCAGNNGGPICVLGRCEACGVSADCAVGQACYPADHECRVKCTADPNCGGDTPFCDTATGACVGCRTNTDCGAERPICEPNTMRCSQCATSADCGVAAPACYIRDGECVECLIDADCPPASGCGADRHCHAKCTADTDCKDGDRRLCDLASGECVQCRASGDCGAAAPVCDERGRCVQCVVAADCPAAAPRCNENRCVQCADNADCGDPSLPICADGQCAQCRRDRDCPATAPICQNAVCVAG